MSRRFLDRAFNRAHYDGKRQPLPCGEKRAPPEKQVASEKASEGEGDAIAQIITAVLRKDYLTALGLPMPGVDELGLPVWPYDSHDITRHYRRRCLSVHPDKNSGERARHAFQLLNEAYKALLDEDQRSEILKTASEAARIEKEKREARASVDERIKINAEKKHQKRKLSKLQHDRFQSEILRQVQERKMQQSIKRQKMAVSRYASKEFHSFSAEMPEEVGPEKGLDGSEIVAVRSHLTEKDEKKSEKIKIQQKLKSKKERDALDDEIPSDDEEEGVLDEWPGAVLTKSKASRRKPRFLF